MRLLLIRHGESEGNAGGVWQGRAEYGLTPLGRLQAARAGEVLRRAGVTRVLSSPLGRAAQTAAVVGEALGLEPVHDEALIEYDVGALSGLTGTEARERFAALFAAIRDGGKRPPIPGEEGRSRFIARVSGFVDGFDWESAETVVAVTHGGVINAACHVALGLEYGDMFSRPVAFAVGNCSLTEIRSDGRGHRFLARVNDGCHV